MMKHVLVVLTALAIGGAALASAQGKCVDPAKLQGCLPAGDPPGGFVREAASATMSSSPYGAVAKAEVTWKTKDDAPRIIHVSISDLVESLGRVGVIADVTGGGLKAVGDRNGDDTYVIVAGKYRGKEHMIESASGGLVAFIVADRFSIEVDSTRVPDIKTLHALIGTMPLGTLEKLSK